MRFSDFSHVVVLSNDCATPRTHELAKNRSQIYGETDPE